MVAHGNEATRYEGLSPRPVDSVIHVERELHAQFKQVCEVRCEPLKEAVERLIRQELGLSRCTDVSARPSREKRMRVVTLPVRDEKLEQNDVAPWALPPFWVAREKP
jgi:hypothetical protein